MAAPESGSGMSDELHRPNDFEFGREGERIPLRTTTETDFAKLHSDLAKVIPFLVFVKATDRDPDLRRRARNLLRELGVDSP